VRDPNYTTAKIGGPLHCYRYYIMSFILVRISNKLVAKCLFRLMEAGESEVDGCRAKSVCICVSHRVHSGVE
jgi:hypothetical protein